MYRDWDPDLLRLSGAALRGPSPAAGLRRPGSNKNTGRVAEPSLGGVCVCEHGFGFRTPLLKCSTGSGMLMLANYPSPPWHARLT